MYLARLDHPADFDGWREAARTALALGVPPEEMAFAVGADPRRFSPNRCPTVPPTPRRSTCPKAFPMWRAS